MSVINNSKFATAVLNYISVCAFNMLRVKFLNFSRSSQFVNIESLILRLTLCLKWNSNDIHIFLNLQPITFLIAFLFEPFSSSISPTGLTFSWRKALWYRNQSGLIDWLLYGNGRRHERVKHITFFKTTHFILKIPKYSCVFQNISAFSRVFTFPMHSLLLIKFARGVVDDIRSGKMLSSSRLFFSFLWK